MAATLAATSGAAADGAAAGAMLGEGAPENSRAVPLDAPVGDVAAGMGAGAGPASIMSGTGMSGASPHTAGSNGGTCKRSRHALANRRTRSRATPTSCKSHAPSADSEALTLAVGHSRRKLRLCPAHRLFVLN